MILVTGPTGLLGSRLLFDLTSQGYSIRALKRESSKMDNINRYFRNHDNLLKKIEWVTGDVTDIFSLAEALSGISKVYHCAGHVSFIPSDRDYMQIININGTTNLVNLCLELGVEKLCHVSSIAALGRTGSGELINEDAVWKTSKHNSSYAVSKYGAEREVWRGVAEGLNAVIVNPGVIVGPGNWTTDSSMIFKQVYKGLRFFTSGVNGFIDVKDVSAIMIQLMESKIVNERYILVGENKPFKEVFEKIADNMKKTRANIYAGTLLSSLAWRIEYIKYLISGKRPVITKETARSASGKYYYDNSKIKNTLDYKFKSVDEAIEETTNFFKLDFTNG